LFLGSLWVKEVRIKTLNLIDVSRLIVVARSGIRLINDDEFRWWLWTATFIHDGKSINARKLLHESTIAAVAVAIASIITLLYAAITTSITALDIRRRRTIIVTENDLKNLLFVICLVHILFL
jgi:hypothetical protein